MNQYTPQVGEQQATVNRDLLALAGCSKAQITEFAPRKFSALPAWLRRRLKDMSLPSHQFQPRKLAPKEGELAFYVDKYRFPVQAHK